MLALAVLAMVATLPGRTQGLGLITEPLLADLALSREQYAVLNFWATIIGAPFALAAGVWIRRAGLRRVLPLLLLALAAVVLTMARLHGAFALFLLVTLSRGIGQSALSVASITLVGQWFTARLTRAMAIYVAALSIGFMLLFPLTGALVSAQGWRTAWLTLGVALLLLAVLMQYAVRDVAVTTDTKALPVLEGHSLRAALTTPAYWVFALGASLYGLVASGIGLFNESILAEQGFAAGIYHQSLAVTALSALAGNALGGFWVRERVTGRPLALAMLLLALGLAAIPYLASVLAVMLDAALLGLAGGFVMVLFFSFWPQAYGRRALGPIQGVAQGLTVLASAIGPWLLARCIALTGHYDTAFNLLAAAAVIVALCALVIRLPHPAPAVCAAAAAT